VGLGGVDILVAKEGLANRKREKMEMLLSDVELTIRVAY